MRVHLPPPKECTARDLSHTSSHQAQFTRHRRNRHPTKTSGGSLAKLNNSEQYSHAAQQCQCALTHVHSHNGERKEKKVQSSKFICFEKQLCDNANQSLKKERGEACCYLLPPKIGSFPPKVLCLKWRWFSGEIS
jgi:hypothetical protein